MTTPTSDQPVSYPRQEAATRRFRLGVPRSFTVAPDGRRVAFIRSAGGRRPRLDGVPLLRPRPGAP